MKQIRVDAIAQDNKKLEQKVETETGEQVKIDDDEAQTTDPEAVPSSIRALLVKLNGGVGAIRAASGFYLQTGPEKRKGYDIVVIDKGQICVLFGKPSVRYFRTAG